MHLIDTYHLQTSNIWKSNSEQIPYKKCHYFEITPRFRGFKLTFGDWLKFSLIEEITYEIDV
jgi:hypothetical protein